VNLLQSNAWNFKIQVQHRRFFTGETPASNTGVDATSPLLAHFSLENGLFTIGNNQYSRTTLLAAGAINPYNIGLGYKIYESANTQGAVIVEFLPYQTKLQFSFWNYNGFTFFDLFSTIPDTLAPDNGICLYTGTCPATGSQIPTSQHGDSDSDTLFMSESDSVFGYRSKDDPPITPEIVEAACGSLRSISNFFYTSCAYDVNGAKNPNIANVVIASVNSVVAILTEQHLLQNFSSIVNTTTLNINSGGTPTFTLPANTPFTSFASITTNDITVVPSSSSSSSTGLGLANENARPNLVLFFAIITVITYYFV